jgi:predicted nuclease of predicted toxin-antitoxin system
VRLLANENFPREAVEALRNDGHDVAWVRTECSGISDNAVLEKAEHEGRIVITLDKDFGELAFRSYLPVTAGVILFGVTPRSPGFLADLAVRALKTRSDWLGHFSVVQEHRVRMTPLRSHRHGEF